MCFQMQFKIKGFSRVFHYLSEKFTLLKNYVTSEGAVSHNVLYYQQLSIAHSQVSFYAKNNLEYLLIVSSAFQREMTSHVTSVAYE